MPENEFEKQVQQKMDELQFVPSPAVWGEVERQIANRKKRRLLFIWLPFLLLLLAGAVWFYDSTPAAKSNKQITSAEKNSPLAIDNKKQEAIEPGKPHIKTETKKTFPNTETSIKENTKKEMRLLSSNENNKTHLEIISTSTGPRKNRLSQNHFKEQVVINENIQSGDHENRIALTKNSSRVNHVSITTLALNKGIDEPTDKVGKQITAGKDTKDKNLTALGQGDTKTARTVIQDNKPTEEFTMIDSVTGNNKGVMAMADIKDSVNIANKPENSKAITKAKPSAKNKKIEWGINLDAGVSKIFNGFSRLLSAVPSYDPASYTASQLNSSPTAGTAVLASHVKSGFAFTAGIFISKDVAKNLKLMTGLNYNYFSTSLQTGSKIDSNKSDVQYRTGNSIEYTNRFHFIEVPLMAEKQLGSRSHFSINAGLAFSILAGSNTLQYDGQKNIYYVDNSRINKTQWSLLGGFNYRVSQKKIKVEIGPQMNYNLSNIFQKQLYGSRHLFFAGIGTKIFFGKK